MRMRSAERSETDTKRKCWSVDSSARQRTGWHGQAGLVQWQISLAGAFVEKKKVRGILLEELLSTKLCAGHRIQYAANRQSGLHPTYRHSVRDVR